MFSWLKRKLKTESAPDPVDSTHLAAAPVSPVPAKVDAMQTPSPAAGVSATSNACSAQPRTDGVALREISAALCDWDEPQPSLGMAAVELATTRHRMAEVVGVQANGRRLIARVVDTARPYSYTLRKDGTYRLEGAPPVTGTRLVLGVDG